MLQYQSGGCVWKLLAIGLILVVVAALTVPLIVFAVRANSKACKEGLLAEQECRNVTRLLELQLTQTRQDLLGTMDQAATCNETMVSDCDSGLRGPHGSRRRWRNCPWIPTSGVGFTH